MRWCVLQKTVVATRYLKLGYKASGFGSGFDRFTQIMVLEHDHLLLSVPRYHAWFHGDRERRCIWSTP